MGFGGSHGAGRRARGPVRNQPGDRRDRRDEQLFHYGRDPPDPRHRGVSTGLAQIRSPLRFLDEPAGVPVLVDTILGRVWTQDELADAVARVVHRLSTDGPELVFCLCDRTAASIIGYLAARRAGHAVALLDAGAPGELTDALIARYRPAFVVRPEDR